MCDPPLTCEKSVETTVGVTANETDVVLSFGMVARSLVSRQDETEDVETETKLMPRARKSLVPPQVQSSLSALTTGAQSHFISSSASLMMSFQQS